MPPAHGRHARGHRRHRHFLAGLRQRREMPANHHRDDRLSRFRSISGARRDAALLRLRQDIIMPRLPPLASIRWFASTRQRTYLISAYHKCMDILLDDRYIKRRHIIGLMPLRHINIISALPALFDAYFLLFCRQKWPLAR